MKRIGLIIIMLLYYVSIVWGQVSTTGTSTYRINVQGRVDGEGSDCGHSRTGGLQWIAAKRKNDGPNSGYTFISGNNQYPGSGRGIRNVNYDENYDFTKTNPVVKVAWHTTRRSGGSCGKTKEKKNEKNVSICEKSYYNFKDHLGLNQPGYTNISVFPVIELNHPAENNRIIASKEYLTITLSDNIDNSYYNWEYAIGSGSFQRFDAAYNNKPILKIKGEDFLPESAFGQTVYIRVNMGYCAGEERKSKETLLFRYNKSAPNIINVDPVNPTCNGYDNGYARIQLDRNLEDGESLIAMMSDGRMIPVTLDGNRYFTIPNLEGNGSGKKYTIQLSGSYKGTPLYTDGIGHKEEITMIAPSPLTFTSTKTDVLCHDYPTGKIEITATGGNNDHPAGLSYYLHFRKKGEQYLADSIAFSAGRSKMTKENLPHGDYQLFVTDYKGCFQKTAQNLTKEETEHEHKITQPDTPLTVALIDSLSPSGFGLSNGHLKMKVEGGMRPTDTQEYTVTWSNKATGTQLKTEVLNGYYNFELLDIPSGTYLLYVRTITGCDTTLQYTLSEPNPLTIDIAQTTPILCNGDNNATLVAQAKGGVLSEGQDYAYKWYKVDNNEQIISGELSNTNKLENIGKGKYQVRVTDKSRIPNDTVKIISVEQPDSVAFSIAGHTDVSCHDGNDATITVTASGGVGRYKLSYTLKEDPSVSKMIPFGTGNTTINIQNLIAGTYVISLVDGNDCVGHFNETDASHDVIIKQPEKLNISIDSFKNPSGFGLSNGVINYRISGGTFTTPPSPSYTIGITDSLSNSIPYTTAIDGQSLLVKANNLPKGKYTISVKDANYVLNGLGGCITTHTTRLTEPDLLTVKLKITSTVDCHGFNTGIINAIAAGGQKHPDPAHQSYIYEWVKIENGTEIVLAETTATLSNLPAGIYKVNITDYSDPANKVSEQIEITQPPLLVTTPTTRNVSCFGGNDGYIHISVGGGVGGYKLFCKQVGIDNTAIEYPIEPDNKTFKLNSLKTGKYEIFILDANGCYAQIQGLDIATIEIKQPRKALEITKMTKIEPSGFGRLDGSITLHISGGTPNPDNSYSLTWKNEQGQVILTTTQGDIVNGQFISTLQNQPDGEYTVEIRDGNYNIAYPDANTACIVIEKYKLTEPKELVVSIEETHYISCNGRSDGELVAHAIGGVANKDGLPYKYKWYKDSAIGFVVLPNETDSVLKNREMGSYKVEIEDYSRIVNITSENYLLVQPDILAATSTQKFLTCGQTTDVIALPTGGTQPYRYEWNTGDLTQTLKDRYPGKYFVFITDNRGCETTTISHITTPSNLEVSGIYQDPICYLSETGSITLAVKGGTSPYTYKWSNGATTKDISNIGAGFYSVVVTEKDGCSYTESFILEDPKPITVDIGEDRTLCKGQELVITPRVKDLYTKFNWSSTNGFTSTKPSVTIKEAGDYYLSITDSKGCIARDTMTLKVSNTDISSEIVVATQIFVNDTIAIVNISNPEPDKMEWLFNENDPIKIVQKEQHFAQVIFTKTGHYSVGIRSHVGDCYQDIVKTVTVIEPDDNMKDRFKESLIKQFYIYPNPTDGKFKAVVKLNRESAVRVRVIDFFNGGVMSDRSFNGKKEYMIDYSLSLVYTNLYLVLLETSSGQMVLKMIAK